MNFRFVFTKIIKSNIAFWTFHYNNAKFNTSYSIKLLNNVHTTTLVRKQLETYSKTDNRFDLVHYWRSWNLTPRPSPWKHNSTSSAALLTLPCSLFFHTSVKVSGFGRYLRASFVSWCWAACWYTAKYGLCLYQKTNAGFPVTWVEQRRRKAGYSFIVFTVSELKEYSRSKSTSRVTDKAYCAHACTRCILVSESPAMQLCQ